jgi:hypothetical protein
MSRGGRPSAASRGPGYPPSNVRRGGGLSEPRLRVEVPSRIEGSRVGGVGGCLAIPPFAPEGRGDWTDPAALDGKADSAGRTSPAL